MDLIKKIKTMDIDFTKILYNDILSLQETLNFESENKFKMEDIKKKISQLNKSEKFIKNDKYDYLNDYLDIAKNNYIMFNIIDILEIIKKSKENKIDYSDSLSTNTLNFVKNYIMLMRKYKEYKNKKIEILMNVQNIYADKLVNEIKKIKTNEIIIQTTKIINGLLLEFYFSYNLLKLFLRKICDYYYNKKNTNVFNYIFYELLTNNKIYILKQLSINKKYSDRDSNLYKKNIPLKNCGLINFSKPKHLNFILKEIFKVNIKSENKNDCINILDKLCLKKGIVCIILNNIMNTNIINNFASILDIDKKFNYSSKNGITKNLVDKLSIIKTIDFGEIPKIDFSLKLYGANISDKNVKYLILEYLGYDLYNILSHKINQKLINQNEINNYGFLDYVKNERYLNANDYINLYNKLNVKKFNKNIFSNNIIKKSDIDIPENKYTSPIYLNKLISKLNELQENELKSKLNTIKNKNDFYEFLINKKYQDIIKKHIFQKFCNTFDELVAETKNSVIFDNISIYYTMKMNDMVSFLIKSIYKKSNEIIKKIPKNTFELSDMKKKNILFDNMKKLYDDILSPLKETKKNIFLDLYKRKYMLEKYM